MTDMASSQWTQQTDADSETLFSTLLTEIRHLNAQMRNDQADIDRLKSETRTIAEHSDILLLQIEGQLDALRRAA